MKKLNFILSTFLLSLISSFSQADINSLLGQTVKIINANSNKALTVPGMSEVNGEALIQYDYLANSDQQWKIEALAAGNYKITNIHSGKALEIADQGLENGDPARQWNYFDVPHHQWKITHIDGERYIITNVNSNKALEVADAGVENGDAIRQWNYFDVAHHQWVISAASTSDQPIALTNLRFQTPGHHDNNLTIYAPLEQRIKVFFDQEIIYDTVSLEILDDQGSVLLEAQRSYSYPWSLDVPVNFEGSVANGDYTLRISLFDSQNPGKTQAAGSYAVAFRNDALSGETSQFLVGPFGWHPFTVELTAQEATQLRVYILDNGKNIADNYFPISPGTQEYSGEILVNEAPVGRVRYYYELLRDGQSLDFIEKYSGRIRKLASENAIETVTFPELVFPGEEFSFSANYSGIDNNTFLVDFFTSDWTYISGSTHTVPPGKRTESWKSVFPENVFENQSLLVNIKMIPRGGTWEDAIDERTFSLSVPEKANRPLYYNYPFYVVNKEIQSNFPGGGGSSHSITSFVGEKNGNYIMEYRQYTSCECGNSEQHLLFNLENGSIYVNGNEVGAPTSSDQVATFIEHLKKLQPSATGSHGTLQYINAEEYVNNVIEQLEQL